MVGFSKFGADAYVFGFGAMSASFVFFWMCFKASCSYILKAVAWKILEIVVGIIMLLLAAHLIFA